MQMNDHAGSHDAATSPQAADKGTHEHGRPTPPAIPVPEMHAPAMHDGMSHGSDDAAVERQHEQTLWVPFLIALLGVWLISSPFTLGYAFPESVPPGVRRITELRAMAPGAARGAALLWSDVLSGAALVILGLAWRGGARRTWAPWAASAVGVWLLFAPLVLWAPTAGAYANDSLVGMLVIALAVLIPGMPGMSMMMHGGPEIPAGWSYSPSSWAQRAPIILLAWVGFFLSRHLAAYQLGHVPVAWEPFFGAGTEQVLDSEVSLAWPVADAGLGVVAYAIEALMGYMGGASRWRTMPWMVTFFGILVVPLGATSIVLVMLQPIEVGAWCTICLTTAVAMLVMIPLALDEVIAMGQFLAQARREGQSLWRVFWMGGTVAREAHAAVPGVAGPGGEDIRSPRLTTPLRQLVPAALWGVTVPWTLLLSALLGVWVLAAPAALGSTDAVANHSYVTGALVIVVAVTAMAEVGRAVRFGNILLGAWLAAAPWVLAGATEPARWNGLVVGLAIVALSIPRGPVRERYGSWQRLVV